MSIAHVGVAGLALARTQQPDAVVLEGMPGMSGYTVARELRGDPALKGVLLIALAGWDQEDARLRSAQAGFDYHLVKPVGPATLVELLARYPRGIRSAREDA